MGTFKKSFLAATIASVGVILGAAYMLWLYKRIMRSKLEDWDQNYASDREKNILLCL